MQTEKILNTEFGISGQIHFETNASGIVMAMIDNEYAKAVISTYGAHIVSYYPEGEGEDVFFLSDEALFGEGKAIRGGTPICWPWFAKDESGFGRPPHGFARNQQWQVSATRTMDDGGAMIQLVLNYTEGSLAVWPYPFQLMLEIVIGKVLTLNLTTKNIGEKTMMISQALHTYFNVSDTAKMSIQGLDGITYLNKLTGFSECTQQGDLKVEGEIDRVYINVPETVTLRDNGFGRDIIISGKGSNTTVVWNPGPETIKLFSDLSNSAYHEFICIETANAMRDLIRLKEGESHQLTAVYQVKQHQ